MRKEDLLLNVERVSRFYTRLKNGYWVEESIPLECCYALSDDVVPWSEREKGEFHELHEGDRWGRIWQSAWLHVTGHIPEAWRGKALALRINVSGEALIFDESGVPLYGLCSSSCFGNDYVKELYELPNGASSDIDLWIEATANGMFGQEDLADTPNFRNPRFGEKASRQCGFCQKLRLVVLNTELRELFYDVEALWELMQCIGEKDYRYTEIVRALNSAFAAMDDTPERADKARACLAPILNRPAMASAKRVTAVGHSHIDVGWLWPIKESIRKSARTFASQIYNLEHFPEFVFGASQPQNYQFIKENYPTLYEKIRYFVKQGRWEPQGGMWVEADCNLINGESMVRQFVHGMNFFKDEFGVEVNNLWLPDVFGYPASMPQIMLKSGCRHFLTQKLSKGRVNVYPFHTFYWIGIDGSKVLTHFPPENNYNSHGNAGSYIQAQNRFAERDFMGEFISLVGIGDGGGGPADSHIRRVRRCADTEGIPAVKFGRADEYFERVEAKYRNDFPEWNGELYLENHQGTFTTHARMKLLNRRAEQQLNATELLIACARDGVIWADELDRLWKILLCNQFHDILPGSCIREVYEKSEKELEDIINRCQAIQFKSATKLLRQSNDSAVAINTLSVNYELPMTLPENWGEATALDADGHEYPCQLENGLVIVHAPLSSFAY
ncbi:MAG: alpha-mannosidase, partial [Victivallales bacterium]|nr:alpha-mannosidase [Victivallales bacterium]